MKFYQHLASTEKLIFSELRIAFPGLSIPNKSFESLEHWFSPKEENTNNRQKEREKEKNKEKNKNCKENN